MVEVLGTRLGRYDIRERIGKGGMAAVYKAWDTNLDRWVAVKVLHDYLVEEEGFKERFEREAKVVASLNHPNIVQVYDFDIAERNGTPIYYMVMTFIPGRSLKSLLDERHAQGQRLTFDEIGNVLRGVCAALGYAHRQGIVHRDVTPGNILFNDHEEAVLADFGLVRLLSGVRLTQSGMTSGTPMYMSPEQSVGRDSDHRSDIYSLGVVLYEMLAGEPPYSGDSAVSILMQHVNEPVPPLQDKNPEITPALAAVVLRAMAKDPGARFQDAPALLTDFECAVSGQVETAVQEELRTVVLPTAAAGARRTPLLWLAAALIPLVLIAAIVIALRAGTAPSPASAIGATDSSNTLALANPPARPTRYASSMTQGPLIFKDEFGPDRSELIWPITLDDPQISRKIENGVYTIRHTIPTTALPTLFDQDHQYSFPFQYEADVTLSDKAQLDSAAGIIFRYMSDDQYYVFGINGMGQVSMWLRYDGRWTELRKQPVNWTPAEGAKPAGQTNHLMLIDNGKQLLGYVNGKLAIDVQSEPVIMSGAIGIYLATTSSQKIPNPVAEVWVDNFRATYYRPATAAATSTGSN